MSSVKSLRSTIASLLRELHLPAMREGFEAEATRARQEELSYEQYLLGLLERETESRRQNRVERLLRESHLPLEKTLEQFDRQRLPRKVALQVNALLDGTFLDRRENVLAFGNPGSGKTHLVCAIGRRLVELGRSVLFTPSSHLVQELLRAKRDLRLDKTLKKLRKWEALILDDIGYVQHDREEMEVLFALLSDRYERASVMLTSNLAFSSWEKIFKDPMTTAAAIGRVVHHSVILDREV
jgi:DNA replication protein DnaC